MSIIDSGHDPRATRATIDTIRHDRQTAFGGALRLGGLLADWSPVKTVQALALIAIEKGTGRLDAPALAGPPTSLMANWQRAAENSSPI